MDNYDKLKTYSKKARLLDRYYIPTRYPNGLPDMTPNMAYDEDDSKKCLESADDICKIVAHIIRD